MQVKKRKIESIEERRIHLRGVPVRASAKRATQKCIDRGQLKMSAFNYDPICDYLP